MWCVCMCLMCVRGVALTCCVMRVVCVSVSLFPQATGGEHGDSHAAAGNYGALSLLGCAVSRGAEDNGTQTAASDLLHNAAAPASLLRECGRSAPGTTHTWVPLVTLDSMGWHKDPATCPQFVKLDVEGMETSVLSGAAALIAACKPVIHAENNVHASSHALLAVLAGAGYDVYWEVAPFSSAHGGYYGLDDWSGGSSISSLPDLSANVLAVPQGFDWSGVPPEIAELVRSLTPVLPSRPRLSQYPAVRVYDYIWSHVHAQSVSMDGTDGVFVGVETLPFMAWDAQIYLPGDEPGTSG